MANVEIASVTKVDIHLVNNLLEWIMFVLIRVENAFAVEMIPTILDSDSVVKLVLLTSFLVRIHSEAVKFWLLF